MTVIPICSDIGGTASVQWPSNGDAAPVEGIAANAIYDAESHAYLDPETGEVLGTTQAWEHATEAQRATAGSRLEAVQRSNALHIEGHPRADADALAAAEAGVSASALGAWRAKVRRAPRGMGLDALIDRPRTGRPPGKWGGPGAGNLWRLWCSDYLREEAPPAPAVHRRLGEVAEQRGWELPPIDAFLRRTNREFTRAEIVRAREGALAAMNLVPHQTRTVADLKPLDIVNGDGRTHDVLVKLPSGKEGRPAVWVWQDVRTRKVLAWRAGETESADLVRTSLHELIVECGVPGLVLVDSTRAASAKWATGGQPGRKRWRSTDEELPGLLKMLDIGYSATKVDKDAAGRGKGRGRSKPVERGFLDLSNHIDTHPLFAGAYTGRSPTDQAGDAPHARGAVGDLHRRGHSLRGRAQRARGAADRSRCGPQLRSGVGGRVLGRCRAQAGAVAGGDPAARGRGHQDRQLRVLALEGREGSGPACQPLPPSRPGRALRRAGCNRRKILASPDAKSWPAPINCREIGAGIEAELAWKLGPQGRSSGGARGLRR